ncbi:hypothetical protein OKW38_002763 [Paraburkholderia sp. MM5496-R1]|uniref:hypothetical protein n=1 Tax=unclassified Paraburkholderia TaxID=2615204 RepID=UPI003D1B9BE4
MNSPQWYEQSELGSSLGTLDLDAYEAAAQPLRRKLVEDGKLLPVEKIRDKWVARAPELALADAQRFFTVNIDQRTFAPAFYLDPLIDPRELAAVSTLLGELHGWSKWHFFTAKNGSLGGVAPLEALREGQVERVKRAARAYVEC